MEFDFLTDFYFTFTKIFEIFSTDLHFPEPIGALSPMDIFFFFTTGFILAELVLYISTRRDAE